MTNGRRCPFIQEANFLELKFCKIQQENQQNTKASEKHIEQAIRECIHADHTNTRTMHTMDTHSSLLFHNLYQHQVVEVLATLVLKSSTISPQH